jgi:hypothetical protein
MKNKILGHHLLARPACYRILYCIQLCMNNISSTHSIKPLEILISSGDDETFQPAPFPVDSDGFIIAFNVEQ